jgi:hypothetical protein
MTGLEILMKAPLPVAQALRDLVLKFAALSYDAPSGVSRINRW